MTADRKTSAYAAAGVDIDAQEKGLARVKKLAKSTFTRRVKTPLDVSFDRISAIAAVSPEMMVERGLLLTAMLITSS